MLINLGPLSVKRGFSLPPESWLANPWTWVQQCSVEKGHGLCHLADVRLWASYFSSFLRIKYE